MMQIVDIVAYSHHGEKRVLSFDIGKVNIITGDGGTGKSQIINVIDYCLGSSDCSLAIGIMRRAVSWWGVRLQLATGQVFVARQVPPFGQEATNFAFFEAGDKVEIPEGPLEVNSNINAIKEDLTRRLSIAEVLEEKPAGQTRERVAPRLRQSTYYLYQGSTTIANNEYLFHGQNRSHVHEQIIDTLPYFLGSIREDKLILKQSLDRAKRQERLAELEVLRLKELTSEDIKLPLALISEARQVGLPISTKVPSDSFEAKEVLGSVLGWIPNEIDSFGDIELIGLRSESEELKRKAQDLSMTIEDAKLFSYENKGVKTEIEQQAARLQSIGLFDTTNQESHTCPLCTGTLDVPVPTADAIKKSLSKLHENLVTFERETPRISKYINDMESDYEEIIKQIRQRDFAIQNILRGKDEAKRLKDSNLKQARVFGKISLWLDSYSDTDELPELEDKLSKATAKRVELEATLDKKKEVESLESICSKISAQMSEWAGRLHMEYNDNLIFSAKDATVKVKVDDVYAPLVNIGSGANWVGFHILALLALHKHFQLRKRPVPNFLILDQPSQAYFPVKDQSGAEILQGDIDWKAVQEIYNLIFDVVAELSPGFQVIIVDHAKFEEDARFMGAIKEEWRGGLKLVPEDWPWVPPKITK